MLCLSVITVFSFVTNNMSLDSSVMANILSVWGLVHCVSLWSSLGWQPLIQGRGLRREPPREHRLYRHCEDEDEQHFLIGPFTASLFSLVGLSYLFGHLRTRCCTSGTSGSFLSRTHSIYKSFGCVSHALVLSCKDSLKLVCLMTHQWWSMRDGRVSN